MKTRITYPAAIILGLSANLLLGGWQPYELFLGVAVPIVIQVGLYILFPVVFILFTAATASLRRYKDTLMVFSSTILWAFITTLALSFLGLLLSLVLPGGLSLGAATGNVSGVTFFEFHSFSRMFVSENAFSQFTISSSSLLPVIMLALVFGIALRPDKEAIRPAYVVMNSFAEAMMRLTRIVTIVGAALLVILSADWFGSIDLSGIFMANLWYFIGLVVAVAASVLILLPLLFGLFTLFKGGNPYRVLVGTFPAMLSAGLSGNILFGATPLIALSQRNNGVRKRVLGISIPLFTILGRGGSALIASFTIMNLMQTSGNSQLSLQTMILVALFSALFSFGASFTPGLEVLFIVILVLRGFMSGATTQIQASLLVLLPCIQMAALIIDTAVIAIGSAFSSRIVSPDDRVPIEEMM